MPGRPRKDIVRIEVRLPRPYAERLQAEAQSFGVSPQEFLVDLIKARYLGSTAAPEPPPEEGGNDDSAQALVDEWM